MRIQQESNDDGLTRPRQENPARVDRSQMASRNVRIWSPQECRGPWIQRRTNAGRADNSILQDRATRLRKGLAIVKFRQQFAARLARN
jgi:hypothetical protein